MLQENILESLEQSIENLQLPRHPENLYEPIRYILALGGKRIRPYALLLSHASFGKPYADAMPGALAIELFHNFTLLHDDIMDAAPLRRGKATVHEKWNTTIAILSGDALMVRAYQCLQDLPPSVLPQAFALFNKTALEVCEGQQLDMDFEQDKAVSLERYIEMIRLKTAVLLGTSLQMGALLAHKSSDVQNQLYQFGMNLGLAFQLLDDYLDCFADAQTFGKQVGGDILDGKKTFLSIKTLQVANQTDAQFLLQVLSRENNTPDKVNQVLQLYKKYKSDEALLQEVENYTKVAFEALDKINEPQTKLEPLRDLAQFLMTRQK